MQHHIPKISNNRKPKQPGSLLAYLIIGFVQRRNRPFMNISEKKSTFVHMEKQLVILSHDLNQEVESAVKAINPDRLFILMDTTTEQLCRPLLQQCSLLNGAQAIVIGATDTYKNLETLSYVWTSLGNGGATRHSMLINLGGGMVTDLGGFAASTFKRGIAYINLPTTLLAMVDASVGGKTGINFNGLKNEIGVFRQAERVIIDTTFLQTLDEKNLRSGYAEMLKHGLISHTDSWKGLLNFDLEHPDWALLQSLVAESIAIKERIVAEDPHEKGIRKALNLGHTAGHALESMALKKNNPVLHGYAVAWGLVCELYLSCRNMGFPTEKMRQTVNFIKQYYGTYTFDCHAYDALYGLMLHDKKNTAGIINFTLLSDIGNIHIDQHTDKEGIFSMLDFYRETMGC